MTKNVESAETCPNVSGSCGPTYWPHFQALFDTLGHISSLSRHLYTGKLRHICAFFTHFFGHLRQAPCPAVLGDTSPSAQASHATALQMSPHVRISKLVAIAKSVGCTNVIPTDLD